MLRIIRTNLNSRGSERLDTQILERVQKRLPTYLIVPEQDTVMREARAAKNLPPHAPLCFEATNFSRFTDNVFRSLGGLSGEYCDSGKRSLIMWRALTELAPTLTITRGRCDVSYGTVSSVMRAIGEVRAAGIIPEELMEASENEKISSDLRLKSKLKDLASVYALYKNLLSDKYLDAGESAEAVIKKLNQNETFLSEYTVFIDGFTSFTEPQYKLIALLAKRCTVEVYLPYPQGCEELFEYTEIRGAIEKLKRSARLAGSDVQIKKEFDIKREFEEKIAILCSGLWHKNANIDNITLQNEEEIRIFEAITPFEMCDFVASDIKRRVIAGAKYRDFAIVARDSEKYRGILDTSLDYAEIPHFFSLPTDASAFEAIKLIYTAYAVIKNSFSREDVISYMKCAFSGISREASDELEMYVNSWQITGKRFCDDTPWNMNPLGYTTRRDDKCDSMLVRINETRKALVTPLISFRETALSAKTVKEQADALLSFLLELRLESLLKKRAEKLASLSEHSAASENSRLWKLISDTLDTLVEVTGDMPSDIDSFLTQFKILISEEQISRIPSYTDRVTVGSADMLRLSEKKHIYVIGMNAGEFPASPSDTSFFSERDKITLSSLGLSVEPEMEIKNAKELFIFNRAVSYATDSITLLYSATSTKFKATPPSETVNRISELCNVKCLKVSSLSAKERIFTAEYALRDTKISDPREIEATRSALIKSGHGLALKISEGDITNKNLSLSESVANELYSRPMSLSQSRLESFSGCPLEHFCKFTLKLGEEKIASFDAASIGSFLHAILENFFRELHRKGISAARLTATERKNLTESAAKKYVMELGEDASETSPITKIKISRLTRAALPIVEGLCEEFSESEFTPKFFELRIGDSQDVSPSPVKIKSDGGHDVSVYGIIDRVDTYKSDGRVYVRVVDYKTGSKEFSPEDLAEGENLQMFLYLKSILETKNKAFLDAVCEGEEGKMIPAGVIYVKSSMGDVKIDTPSDSTALQKIKDSLGRDGMVLDDENIISAMGLKYTPLYSAKSPNKIPESKKNLLFSEGGFGEIMETVENAVSRIADGIASGDASANPKEYKMQKTRCTYCKFKPICRVAIEK